MASRIEPLENIPYSDVQKFLSEFYGNGVKGKSGGTVDVLWQGIITAIDFDSSRLTSIGTATVLIRGEECTPVRWVSGVNLAVGSIVYGIQDGRVKIILGVLGTQGIGRLGFSTVPITGQNFGVDTTIREIPYMSVSCGPVKENQLIRADFKIWNASGVAATWWFLMEKSEGTGGTKTRVDQYDFIGGSISSSPCSRMTWVTDQDYANLVIWIACQLPSSTGTLALSSGDITKNQHSFLVVENLGPVP